MPIPASPPPIIPCSPNPTGSEPGAESVAQGYGTKLIARFVRAESACGVIMIGGLPTDFDTVPLPASDITASGASYLGNGGKFLELPNHSRCPPEDFFNREDHLARPCQYLHSIAIARALGLLIYRPTASPSPNRPRH